MVGPLSARVDRFLAVVLIVLAAAAPLSVGASQSVLGCAVALGLYRWVAGRKPIRTGLEAYAGLLVLWALIMIPFSSQPAQSLLFARRFYPLAALWLFAWAGGTESRRIAVLSALLTAGAGLGIYGIYQLWRQGEGAHLSASGQLVGRVTLAQGYMTGGGIMMILALVALAFLLSPVSRRQRALTSLALVSILASLILTMTRSAWLGFSLGGMVVLAAARPRIAPIFLALLVLGTWAMPATYRARVLSAFDWSDQHNQARVVMWQTGWRMLKDHPVTGVGDRDLKEIYRSYHPGQTRDIPGHLHSNYVMFGAIWGLPGLAFALLLLAAIPVLLLARWRRLRAIRSRPPPLQAGWILAALGVWTGFCVAGFFEWNFGDAEVVLLLWIVAGMGLARIQPDSNGP
jgi:O-antigen ligase